MAISGAPNNVVLAETLKMEFLRVQPPDFWTEVKDATWPDFPALEDAGEQGFQLNPQVLDGEGQHSVRLWSPGEVPGELKEDNTREDVVRMLVQIAWVVRSPTELARQVLMARADMRTVFRGNGDRIRPGDTTGPYQWAETVQVAPIEVEHLDSGLAVIWGVWGIEYNHPDPKG